MTSETTSGLNETPLQTKGVVMDRAKLVSIAGELFTQHGLTARGWRLEFRTYGQRLGYCCSRKQIIALDAFYAENNDDAIVLDTLLHEIAHALVGPWHGHGQVWKAMARRLGCVPKACGNDDVILRPGKYQAICPGCGRQFNMYRKPLFAGGYHCPACGEDQGKLVFQVVGEVV